MLKRILKHLWSRFFIINLLLILVVSIFAGHYIVVHGRNETWAELRQMSAYYYSVAYSAMIAMVLQLGIYLVSYKLSRKHRGKGLTISWALEQLLYGVVMILMLELLLAAALFGLHGLWLPETSFFKKLFLPIVLFVLIVNLCYIIYYMNKYPRAQKLVKYLIPKKPKPKPQIKVSTDLPALVYAGESGVMAYGFSGNPMIWTHSIRQSIELLGTRDYYSGQRHWLVHRLAIADLESIPGKRVKLILAFEFKHEMIVSRRRSSIFRAWFGEAARPLDDRFG